MKKINYFFFGLMLSSQAFALSVDFYDEQQNNPGATGIRLRINNDSNAPINDAKVRYYFHNTANMSYEVSGYYLAGASLTWANVNDNLAYFEISAPSIPVGYYPDNAGFSLALHYNNWSSWDKTQDYSYQATPSISENNKIVILSGDQVVYGTLPASVAAGSTPTSVPSVATASSSSENDQTTLMTSSSSEEQSYSSANAQPHYATPTPTTEVSNNRTTVEDGATVINSSKGTFAWDIHSDNDFYEECDYCSGVGIKTEFISIDDYGINWNVGARLKVEKIGARRDTKMLDLSWLADAEGHPWDRPNVEDLIYDVHESTRCWAVAIEGLNHYYGGNLTQDEIVYYAKYANEEPLLSPFNGVGGARGATCSNGICSESGEIIETLKWALNNADLHFQSGAPSYDVVKNAIDQGKPLLVSFIHSSGNTGHDMILYGYAGTSDKYVFFYMNANNNGSLTNSIDYDNSVQYYMIPDVRYGDVQMTNYLVHMDSDGDGITDFEEGFYRDGTPRRFGTDVNKRDSDGDGIEDKREIYDYMIMTERVVKKEFTINEDNFYKPTCPGIENGSNLCESLINVTKNADQNGINGRREVDPDDNGNGRLDGLDGRGELIAPMDIPGNYTLYGREYVRVNDGVKCFNTSFESNSYCDIASDSRYIFTYESLFEEKNPVIVGSRAFVGNIDVNAYNDENPEIIGKVFMRSSSTVGNVNIVTWNSDYESKKDDINALTTFVERQNGAIISDKVTYNSIENGWLDKFDLNFDLPNFVDGTYNRIIQSGQTYNLKDGAHLGSLVVNSGAMLIIEPGEMYVSNNIQIDAGANIVFAEPGKGTIIHLNGGIRWNYYNTTNNSNWYWTNVAKGFKLIQHSSEEMYINGPWAGTIYAPLAPIIMGQVSREIYGRVLARSITVHQYSKIYRVDFNPTDATDVAYLAK